MDGFHRCGAVCLLIHWSALVKQSCICVCVHCVCLLLCVYLFIHSVFIDYFSVCRGGVEFKCCCALPALPPVDFGLN